MTAGQDPRCRICGSPAVIRRGQVEYLEGFPCRIVDCEACGCRSSEQTFSLHDRLHQLPAISYYAEYHSLLDETRACFERHDLPGLEAVLRRQPKYRFVIDRVQTLPRDARLLEWGCSRGYLTSLAILDGRDITGVDVSAEALHAARAAFGDHFVTPDSPTIAAGAPYDAIYHVGLIGCVPDPIGLTHRLLSLLKPGGRLWFNAPNRNALHRRGQLWLDSVPPPEVVTLFPPGFWSHRFRDVATVTEHVLPASAQESAIKTLHRWVGGPWRAPTPYRIDSDGAHTWQQPTPGPLMRACEAVLSKLSQTTGLRLGAWPLEFGLFVEMVGR